MKASTFIDALLPFFEMAMPSDQKRAALESYLGKVTEPAILRLFQTLLDNPLVSTEMMYDSMATFYDQAFPDREHAAGILDLLDPGEARGQVLDVGCGTGESIRPLLDRKGFSPILGVDFSREMLRVAEKKLAVPIAEKRVRLFQGDFMQPPSPEIQGNRVVVSVGVSRHAPLGAETGFLRFLAEVLVEKGIALVAFVTHAQDPAVKAIDRALERWMQSRGVSDRRYIPEEIPGLFAAAGFEVLRSERHPSRYLYEKLFLKAQKR